MLIGVGARRERRAGREKAASEPPRAFTPECATRHIWECASCHGTSHSRHSYPTVVEEALLFLGRARSMEPVPALHEITLRGHLCTRRRSTTWPIPANLRAFVDVMSAISGTRANLVLE